MKYETTVITVTEPSEGLVTFNAVYPDGENEQVAISTDDGGEGLLKLVLDALGFHKDAAAKEVEAGWRKRPKGQPPTVEKAAPSDEPVQVSVPAVPSITEEQFKVLIAEAEQRAFVRSLKAVEHIFRTSVLSVIDGGPAINSDSLCIQARTAREKAEKDLKELQQ